MRPIDADALIEKCGDWYVEEGTESGFIGTLKNLLATMPTIQPQSTTGQLNDSAQSTNLIDRQAAIDAIVQCTNCGDEDTLREYVLKHSLDNGWTGGILEALDAVKDLPTVQPEPSIPLSWIEKYIEWLRSLDNEFANLAAAHISVMVKKWRDEQNEVD